MSTSTTRVLFTGASGYIGGTLLKHILLDPSLKSALEIFALVRSDSHVETVKSMGIKPLQMDMMNEEAVRKAVIDNEITFAIHTASCFEFAPAKAMIEGLAAVKQKTGKVVHFIATSGAKAFSSQAGIPVESEGTISDAGAVYEIQKKYKAIFPLLQKHIDVNNSIQELCESLSPLIPLKHTAMTFTLTGSGTARIDGPGEGFGNKISIQYVALVAIAAKLGKLWHIDEESASWPLMHLHDMTTLYLALIRSILSSSPSPPYGKPSPPTPQGYYFAENGTFNWVSLSLSILKHLNSPPSSSTTPKLVQDPDVKVPEATPKDIEAMAQVISYPAFMVPLAISGRCDIRGDNARKALGWSPVYGVEHLMGSVGEEVDFILGHLPK